MINNKNLIKNNKHLKLFIMYIIKKILFNYNYIKKYINNSIKFIKLFINYIIEKLYYKSNNIDFVIKAITDVNVFNFFIKLNKLKNILTFSKVQDKSFVRLMYYYIIMLMYIVLLGPISWFLLRVVTDNINWMMYVFEHTNLSLLL